MPEDNKDERPDSPTPAEVVAAARAAAPLPAVAETTAQPVPAPAPATAPEPVLSVGGYRLDLRTAGILIASALAGILVNNIVLVPIGISLEPTEVRDLRINEARCQESLVASRDRVERVERRLTQAEAQIEEAKDALQDLARACAVGGVH